MKKYVIAGAVAVALLFGACNQTLLGSYNGAHNVSGAKSFDQETGTTSAVYSDYLDGTSNASECQGDPFPLPDIKGQLGSMTLELSVPLPGYKLGQNGQQLLAGNAYAPASWDACMTNLAQNLVADGFANAIIRPMWEPDSGYYSNEDLKSAAAYGVVFKDAVQSMQAVSGQSFSFDWYWGANFDNTTNTTAYPGSQYVTDVTFDQYDQSWYGGCGISWGSTWTATQSQCIWDNDISHNLANLLSFASNEGKPVSIGEWGVINRSDGHGGGDDPTFVNNFSTWLNANSVAWASYFNFNSGGDSILSDFPNSLQAFKADL